MERWSRCVAFVSGVSTEIGVEICKRFLSYGMIVIGCGPADVMDDLAEEIRKGKRLPGQLRAIRCNLSNEMETLAMFHKIRSTLERIHICVNIAGFSSTSLFRECDSAHLRNTLQENIMAINICTRESMQLMKENYIKDGQIIQVVQIHSLDTEHMMALKPSDSNMYKGVKHMICAYTEALRQELKAQNSYIRVASVYPDEAKIEIVFEENQQGDFVVVDTGIHTAEAYVDRVIDIMKTPIHETLKDAILMP